MIKTDITPETNNDACFAVFKLSFMTAMVDFAIESFLASGTYVPGGRF